MLRQNLPRALLRLQESLVPATEQLNRLCREMSRGPSLGKKYMTDRQDRK